MSIGEICNRDVVIAEKSLPVPEVAQLMRKHHVGSLVVMEEQAGRRRPVGIVTDRDIVVQVVAAGVPPESLTAGDIMSPSLATVQEGEGMLETLRQMRIRGIRRLPVVSAAGALVGIITLDDVMMLLAEELNELAKAVAREQEREAAIRN
jgi:CBS domain-containing protein